MAKEIKPHWKSSEIVKELAEAVNKLTERVEDLENEVKLIRKAL